ncbi:predicted protein [Coccidioides posadasii str. Silveira]|uniref:Predicted protein n=1 Tax=Coccidioides posadasii (strain RMSCC 757 / Silveira) TaxID=443226 RepID=E9DJY7_COCPS|nr:predicted protein [Coccidioides posadasii str. Silveira]
MASPYAKAVFDVEIMKGPAYTMHASGTAVAAVSKQITYRVHLCSVNASYSVLAMLFLTKHRDVQRNSLKQRAKFVTVERHLQIQKGTKKAQNSITNT